MERWLRWLGLFLGVLLIVAGIAETVRLVSTGDGGLLFWFPTLVGGGALILAGTLTPATHRRRRVGLTVAGCLAGLLPTMWTLVVPVLLIVLAVATVSRQQGAPAAEVPGS